MVESRLVEGARRHGDRRLPLRRRSQHSASPPLLLAALALALAALAASAPAASAKDYAIRDVRIEAHVEQDGTLVVRETREFEFDGDFSRVYWILDKAGSDGIEVTGRQRPGGRARPTDDPTRPAARHVLRDRPGRQRPGRAVLPPRPTSVGAVRHRVPRAGRRRALGRHRRALLAAGRLRVGRDTDRCAADVTVARRDPRPGARMGARSALGRGHDRAGRRRPPAGRRPPGRALSSRSASSSRARRSPGRPRWTASGSPTCWPRRSRWADEANAAARPRPGCGASPPSPSASSARWLGLVAFLLLFFKYGREHRTIFREQVLPRSARPRRSRRRSSAPLCAWGTVKDEDAVATLLDLANRKVISLDAVGRRRAARSGRVSATGPTR